MYWPSSKASAPEERRTLMPANRIDFDADDLGPGQVGVEIERDSLFGRR